MNATLPMIVFDDRLFAADETGDFMSDCSYLPLISAFHDGELSDERTADVESHLTHCSDCRTELAELRSLSASISDIELPSMPVTSRLRLRKQASVFAIAGRVRFVRMMTAVAASIFIVAGSILAFQQFRSGGRTANPGSADPVLNTQPSLETHSSPESVFYDNQTKKLPAHDAGR